MPRKVVGKCCQVGGVRANARRKSGPDRKKRGAYAVAARDKTIIRFSSTKVIFRAIRKK